MKKFIYLAIFVFSTLSLFAQKNTTFFLDKHFRPLSKKDIEQAHYQKIISPISDGKQTERIEDLDGKLIRLTTHELDGKKKVVKTISEFYGEEEKPYKISTLEVDKKMELLEYFQNDKLVGRFLCNDNDVVFGMRVIDGEQVETSKNVFEPDFAVSKQQFKEYLRTNLDYPDEAKHKKIEGTVTLALEIMPDGTVHTMEVINDEEVPLVLQEEAKRVIAAFDKGFKSALDVNGNPVRKWMYVPVRFSLG